jgi:hypothetical protein
MNENKSEGLEIILNGGLNQLYTDIVNKFINYEQLITFIFGKIIKNDDKLKEILLFSVNFTDDYSTCTNSKFEISEFSKNFKCILKEKFSLDFDEEISNNLKEIKSNFVYLDIKIIDDIRRNYHNLNLVHDNPIHAFADYVVLEINSYSHNFNFNLKNNLEFITNVTKNPKKFFVFENDLSRLLEFSNLGCWTTYLTNYTFTSFSVHNNNPFQNLIVTNIKILKEKGKFFNFSTHVFHQLKYYMTFISEINKEIFENKADYLLLEEKLYKLNPIRVLTFYKINFKKGEFRKAMHYTSNEKVLFCSHIGGLSNDILEFTEDVDLSLNGKINIIMIKISENQEVQNFSNFIKTTELYPLKNKDCFMINSCVNLPVVTQRYSMSEFLQNFCMDEKTKDICDKHNTQLFLPTCHSVDLKEVYDYTNFKSFLNEKNLKLPVIIKYTGPRSDFNHLLINIITEDGIQNYIEFMKNYAKGYEDKISMLIQSYVNHGGYVFKLYRVNDDAYIYSRPSLPDASEELTRSCQEYKNGFFKIYTNDLFTEEYTNFWKKLSSNEKVCSSIDREFLKTISTNFENYSKMSLFGLDFLFDIENKHYYLIDVNFFPGYKELINEFNGILIDHCISYFKKFKENGKIFD